MSTAYRDRGVRRGQDSSPAVDPEARGHRTKIVAPIGRGFSSPASGSRSWERLRLRDRITPGVRVLFVGINPGVRSAQTGHHFAGPSNRFWKLLYESGLVPEPITFEQDDRLPAWGYGITNVVPRPTPGINDLTPKEYRAGARALVKKIDRFKPEVLALVGVTVWRALLESLGEKDARTRPAQLGFQPTRIAGARVCVLPNPSGRNANYSYAEMLAAFRQLRSATRGAAVTLPKT